MIYPGLLLLIGIIVIFIAHKTPMLRNDIFNIDNFNQLTITNGINKPRPAFSLGRTQLAFWTIIIVSSFIYAIIAHFTDPLSLPAIDPVNLLLLGIAGGTTAVAKVIDTSQQNNQGLSIPQQDYPSKGFFMDIISDQKGVSIYRLQNVIWTVVVGFIYIVAVYQTQKLPDQSVITNQLLGLIGVSSGTYLGLKTTENNVSPVAPSNVNVAKVVTVTPPDVAQTP